MRFKNVKNRFSIVLLSAAVFSLFAVTACGDAGGGGSDENEPALETKWTIMYYGDGDCNLESALLEDVAEMKSGIADDQGVNIIVLFDRISGYSSDSSVFGQNFTDTRLYRITNGKAWRISGSTQFPEITKKSSYEANMGSAATLKKFIQFCKANYPAENYSLILSNHGGGARKKKSFALEEESVSSSVISKNICYDQTSGNDFLYTGEISDTLTSSESVQLFGLDACLMSSVEFAYQFRNDSSNTGFKAEIMVASAPLETGNGWDYEAIFDRLQSGGGDNGTTDTTLTGNELYYDPATLTAVQLGAIIVEEQRDSTSGDSSQSLTCLDLSKIKAVKDAVDVLAVALVSKKSDSEILRGGSAPAAAILHYFDETDVNDWVSTPFFDLYDLANAINTSGSFIAATQTKALTVKTAVDDLVIYSFANSYFTGFTAGKSGVHIFFPDGDYSVTDGTNTYGCWELQWWYNSIDLTSSSGYGKLAWCIDGRNTTASTVGNWFELLDSWYDVSGSTGVNGYQW